MGKKVVVSCVLLLLLSLLGTVALADTLDFNMAPPTSGSISYAGGSAPLVGSNISVDTVTSLGSGANTGVTLNISGGLLNWTTGAFTGGGGGTPWNFAGGAGSSIVITGGIAALGIANNTTLLSGTWQSAQVVPFGNQFDITGGTFLNIVNNTLASYFGSPVGATWNGNINLSFYGNGTTSFSSTQVLSGDAVTSVSVAEPASASLLGLGLFGIAGLGLLRRKERSLKT